MKRLLLAFALASQVAIAQPVWVPSPIGAALSAGVWLTQPDEKVYKIKVIGYGNTEKEARNEGFRVAIEHCVGELILSQRTVSNDKVATSIINYSSGYVKDYTVEKNQTINGKYALTMTVYVKSSKIAERLQADSIAKAAIQYTTLSQSTTNGDKVINAVLDDFPVRAFKLTINKLGLDVDVDRTPNVVVRYTIEWNKEYIASIGEALDATKEDVDSSLRNSVYRIDVRNGSLYNPFTKIWTTWTKDSARFDMFRMALENSRIRLTIKNTEGIIVFDECTANEGDHVRLVNRMLVVDGSVKETRELKARVYDVESLDKLEVSVVRPSQCRRFI